MKKAMLLANDTTYVYNLRRELIQRLVADGYEVAVVSEPLLHQDELRDMGCRLVDLSTGRHGTNPFADLVLFFKYLGILRSEKPDVVLPYNIKPNVYGGLACRLLGLRYMPNITGLGTAVEYPGLMQKLTTRLYKMGVAGAECVFFQNAENQQFFQDRKLLGKKSRTCLLPGSGVNLQVNSSLPYPQNDTVNFLFTARVMKEKGIDLYLDAAKAIGEKHENVLFHICGRCDDEKYIDILRQAEAAGKVKYHGEQKNMRAFVEMADCIVHPSYYPEGMSNVLLEGAAGARPLIATDRSGCREIVDDGITGYVIPCRQLPPLIDAIEAFLALPHDAREAMGKAGRAKVEREFDRQLVVDAYMEQIRRR